MRSCDLHPSFAWYTLQLFDSSISNSIKSVSELNQILFISILEQQADCSMFNDEGKLDNYSDNYTSTLLFTYHSLQQWNYK